MDKKYICPICGYDKLDESPYGEDDKFYCPSFDICPNCNCEFGYDLEMRNMTIEEYRRKHLITPWKKKYLNNLENDKMQSYIRKINEIIGKDKYKQVSTIVQDEINKLDPMGLDPGETCPIDEYNQEVEMIVSALKSCKDERELAETMASIFKLQFGQEFPAKIFYECTKNILEKTKNLLK